MMIKPISEYDKGGKNSQGVGRPRKAGPRLPNGRLKRFAAKQVQFVVYLLSFPAAGIVKVGMTGNFDVRMADYRAKFGAEFARCAEFYAPSRADAAALEKRAVGALAERFDRHSRREWFKVPVEQLEDAVGLLRQCATDALGEAVLWQRNSDHVDQNHFDILSSINRSVGKSRTQAMR